MVREELERWRDGGTVEGSKAKNIPEVDQENIADTGHLLHIQPFKRLESAVLLMFSFNNGLRLSRSKRVNSDTKYMLFCPQEET